MVNISFLCTYLYFYNNIQSKAHAPTAVVTFTRRAWLVPVNKLTSGVIPPLHLIASLPSTFYKIFNYFHIYTMK